MMEETLREIASHFQIEGGFVSVKPNGEGHINSTYLYQTTANKYTLQVINHNVFKHPELVMENMDAVTEHLKKKIREKGGDTNREAINLIHTYDGNVFHLTPQGEYYRMYLYIDDAKTYQTVQKPVHFYNAAYAFGNFQNMLADFPAEKLHETIPDFHNTKSRVAQLQQAVKDDKAGRAASCAREIEFALSRASEAGVLIDSLQAGILPLRVTHNDTKFNNIVIDNKTDEGICVIDLDTVMPGSMLFDYGDAIRFGASSADEDEKDLSKVWMDIDLFTQYTDGFLSAVKDSITSKELEYMALSAKILTYECGIRFLADHLNGDTYFKIHRTNHNLDRCRTQLKLVADMEKKMDVMNDIVMELYQNAQCSHYAKKQV